MSNQAYAGDLTPEESYRLLAEEPKALLIDVRTEPEWAFVGLPDLTALGKETVRLPWQIYPSMAANPGFVGSLSAAVEERDRPLIFLCRSGGRSTAAAIAMTAAGYSRCYNVIDGFEGGLDNERHRGRSGGWKAAGLPWAQS